MAKSSLFNSRTSGSAGRTSPRRALIALVALALLAAGCGGGEQPDVRIEYRQVAYFPTYQVTPDTPGNPGPTGVYILYRINSIRNNGEDQFSLNPNRFTAVQGGNSKEHAAHEAQLLGDNAIEMATVEGGENQTDVGCMIITARVDNAEERFGSFRGTTVAINLRYESLGDTTVRVVREEGNTGFRLLDPATPETIQAACRGEGG